MRERTGLRRGKLEGWRETEGYGKKLDCEGDRWSEGERLREEVSNWTVENKAGGMERVRDMTKN